MGGPGKEEILARTATLSWTRKSGTAESFVPGVFAADVAFLDGVACEIALRSNQQVTSRTLTKLAKPFLPGLRRVDFAKSVSNLGAYNLSNGTFVSANKHKGHTVIVTKGADYVRNEEVFYQEAATIRPPTSDH